MSASVSGWHPDFAYRARELMTELGVQYVQAAFADERPLPGAFSLSQFILWHHDQGQVGTCYGNATTQANQTMVAACGEFEPVQLSRAFTCYACKAIEGGSPANGGSVTNALIGQSDMKGGQGCCHEELWPYKDDSWYLARRPSSAAVSDAAGERLHQVAEVELGDGWKRSIFNGHPVSIGIWWPYGWDSDIDSTGRAQGIGHGGYGHALMVAGWDDDWDGHLWWQIENSHGPIYHPIPAERAARIPGYKPASPDKTFDFWVRDDWLREVLGYGNAEQVAAAGVTGFKRRVIPVTWQGFQ